ncbi:hypothetical protein [Peristeroidobacter soli]|uniref:hypothetical protein n=1 Tax=Peristeroidobacter soli TaxID=2497877 RepID=UPI00101B6D59|nr:hypothetical protein [Peristeroidobacter soli]
MDDCQTIELAANDIRIVGNERGTLELQGTSTEARAMCNAILASLHCGARLAGIRCVIQFTDIEEVVIESDRSSSTRHTIAAPIV